jgi:outer membrane protein assembly factor BamE (lipoprotein component of BamABCDE complex)|tara:strand:+ start:211 stop:675 length:465 start_codon:yes stop_codon:yes gene_type:complete
MKNLLLLIIILLHTSNCALDKVIKHHGVIFLEKKQNNLIINTSNKNDIIDILGPPSTSGTFDKDLWIYIERNTSSSRLFKLGKRKLLTNNVLILELNSRGVLVNKEFFDKDKMNNIKFSEDYTKMSHLKKSFVYDFLSSLRQKINDPLGKKRIK